MAYEGWMEYGGETVANIAATVAYVEAGYTPDGFIVEDCTGTCEDFSLLFGVDKYRTPALDGAPWYDPEDPDTADFAGVVITGTSGLDDSTRTVEMTDTVTAGARPRRPRYNARTVGVTALLVGKSTAAVQAGFSWLRQVLHRECDDPRVLASLRVYTACPSPFCDTAYNPDAAPIIDTYEGDNVADFRPWSGNYNDEGFGVGVFRPDYPLLGMRYGGAEATTVISGNPHLWTLSQPWAGLDPAAYTDIAAPVKVTAPEPVRLDTHSWRATWVTPVTGGHPVLGARVFRAFHSEIDPDAFPAGVYVYVWVYVPSGSPDVRIASFNYVSGSYTGETAFGDSTDLKDEWVRLTVYVPYRTSYRSLDVGIIALGDADPAGKRVYVDGVQMAYGGPGGGRLSGPVYDALGGPVSITWDLPSITAGMVHAILDPTTGAVLATGPTLEEATTWDLSHGVPFDQWAPGLLLDNSADVTSLSVTYQPPIEPADCARPYLREYPAATTIEGPIVTEWVPVTDDAHVARVSWTWTASPWRYGAAVPLIQNFGRDQDPTLVADGVTWEDNGEVPALPWNTTEPVPALSCAYDPCNPGFTAAPAAPTIPDPNRVSITTQSIKDLTVCLTPEVIPDREGALRIRLTAQEGSGPRVGVRVRVWDDATPLCQPGEDNAHFAYEYLIDYIEEGATLTIDGVTDRVTVLCPGDTAPVDASGSVRGNYGGPILTPVVSCGRRYLIHIQWLHQYPRNCPPHYALGDTQGDLYTSIDLHLREG